MNPWAVSIIYVSVVGDDYDVTQYVIQFKFIKSNKVISNETHSRN